MSDQNKESYKNMDLVSIDSDREGVVINEIIQDDDEPMEDLNDRPVKEGEYEEVNYDDEGDETVKRVFVKKEAPQPEPALKGKTTATELESRFYTGFVEYIQSENALLYLLNKRIGDTEVGVRKVRILTSLLYILVGIAIGLGLAALLGYRYVGFDRPPAEPPTMSVPAE